MTIESTEQFVEKMRVEYETLIKGVAGKPMEFTEVLAKATFWMRVFYDAYGNDPVAQTLFETAIQDMALGTVRIPTSTDGKVH